MNQDLDHRERQDDHQGDRLRQGWVHHQAERDQRQDDLTKPGIIFGNVLSVAGGFFLASKGHVDLAIFLAAMIGTSLVVASGCVFNNCIDRDIDIKMERTKNRVLVQGLISLKLALVYATVLGVAGDSSCRRSH